MIGVADARWGEVGCAFIVLRDNASFESEKLRAFCREWIAPYKIPARFIAVRDLPRTPAGKVQKHLLRAETHTQHATA